MSFSVRSNEVIVSISGNPITGCIEYGVDSQINSFPLQDLGGQVASGGYIKSLPTDHSLSLTWLFGPDSADIYLGGRLANNNFYSSGKHNFVIQDTKEQQLISGAYLNGFNIEVPLGEFPTFSCSFDCDTVDINNTFVNDPLYEPRSGDFDVFMPQEIEVSNISLVPTVSTGENCIQSVSISAELPRTPIRRIGSRVPFTRAIKGNATINVSITLNKTKLKEGLTNNYLDQIDHNTGELTVVFDTTPNSTAHTVNIKQLQLQSISENLSLDGFSTITYNYNGLFNGSSFSIQ